ncbi:hypothetical protein ACP70R_040036 [Stipagrostis hirtigluma subsp. patula]
MAAAEATDSGKECERILFFFQWPQSAEEERQVSRVANMPPKRHVWRTDEEEFMMEYSKSPAMIEKFHKCKLEFYQHLADALNGRPVLPPDSTGGTTSGTLITKYGPEFSTLFVSNEATSSASVQRTNKKEKQATEATDYKTSLKFLADCGVGGTELYSFASALTDEQALSCFLVMKTFRERKQFLNELVESGIGKKISQGKQ